jgi:hypothetical protein
MDWQANGFAQDFNPASRDPSVALGVQPFHLKNISRSYILSQTLLQIKQS